MHDQNYTPSLCCCLLFCGLPSAKFANRIAALRLHTTPTSFPSRNGNACWPINHPHPLNTLDEIGGSSTNPAPINHRSSNHQTSKHPLTNHLKQITSKHHKTSEHQTSTIKTSKNPSFFASLWAIFSDFQGPAAGLQSPVQHRSSSRRASWSRRRRFDGGEIHGNIWI